jgi:hypothetical protein
LRIEAVLAPLFLTSLFIPQYMIYKGTGFAVGFGLFGDPIISPGLKFLNEKFPRWKEMLEPKKQIFHFHETRDLANLFQQHPPGRSH